MGERGPDLPGLPDWVKSLGLGAEAAAATDRCRKPVWAALKDDLRLLPAHPRQAPMPALPAGAEQLEFEAVEELEPGEKWQARFQAMWPDYRTWYTAAYHPAEGRAEYRWPGSA